MDLEYRVQRLEDIEAVTKVMNRAGRWYDRCEMTSSKEDAALFYDTLFAEGGTMEFPFGKWGPQREEIIEQLSAFSQNIDWSLHHFTNSEVELNVELDHAVFHAIEIIPILIDNTAQWMFVENESELHKIEGQWKLFKYGIIDFKAVDNTAQSWPKFEQNENTWMFKKVQV